MPLVEMQLEDLFRGRSRRRRKTKEAPSMFPVQEVSVSVRNCVLLVQRQRKLFDENPRRDGQALAHLINRLSSRLGAGQVLRPVGQRGILPEETCRFRPLTGQPDVRPDRNRRGSRGGHPLSPLQRPLLLHPCPVEITAVALDGTPHSTSVIPAMFVCDQQRLRVTARWGPERIETAWWRGPVVRRDYWRVETDGHRWLWVYRNLQNRRWYLHGEF
jgi:protein ImuB